MKEISSEANGKLFILTCHCVFDTVIDRIYAEHPGDQHFYEAMLSGSVQLVPDEGIFVISGGKTKIKRDCSESRSYAEWLAKRLSEPSEELLKKIFLEEYALTSIENLLFSIYVYIDEKHCFPEEINVFSWNFKEDRFQATFKALQEWQTLREWSQKVWGWTKNDTDEINPLAECKFTYQSMFNLPKEQIDKVKPDEEKEINLLKDGIEKYYKHSDTIDKLKRRDPFNSRPLAIKRYEEEHDSHEHTYPLPFRTYKFVNFTVSDC